MSPRTLDTKKEGVVLSLVYGMFFFGVLFQEKTRGVSALQGTSSFCC